MWLEEVQITDGGMLNENYLLPIIHKLQENNGNVQLHDSYCSQNIWAIKSIRIRRACGTYAAQQKCTKRFGEEPRRKDTTWKTQA